MMRLTLWLWPLTLFGQVQETMTVAVKDIRVHVLDRDSRPVTGLTRDDFILMDGGQVRPFDFFEEVTIPLDGPAESESRDPDAPTAVPRPRYLALFLDSGQMRERNFELARRTIADFVNRHASPQTYFKLVHLDGVFRQPTQFTTNRQIIIDKLGALKYRGLLLKNLSRAQRLIKQEKEFQSSRGDVPQGHIKHLVEEKARLKYEHYRAYYYAMKSLASAFEHVNGAKSVHLFSGGGHVEPGGRYATIDLSNRLGRALNEANATVYTVMFTSPAPILFAGVPSITDVEQYMTSINSDGSFDFDSSANTIQENRYQYITAPRNTALDSGGLFELAMGENKVAKKMGVIDAASTHYYRLGYTLPDAGGLVKIEIRLKNKQRGWRLFYGGEFSPRTPYLRLDEPERDIALNAMLENGNTYRDDLEADWGCSLFPAEDGLWRTAILGRFPMGKPPEKGYELGFVALDSNRQLLDKTIATLTHVPRQRTCFFYDVLIAGEPPRYVRASARNLDTGELSFHELEVAPPDGRVGLSEPMMTGNHTVEMMLGVNQLRAMHADAEAEAAAKAPPKKKKWWVLKPKPLKDQRLAIEELERERQAQAEKDRLRQELDPLRIGPRFFSAAVKPYSFRPGKLFFFVHFYEPPEGDYTIETVITSQKGIVALPNRIIASWRADERESRHMGALEAAALEAGEYVLWVRARDPASGESFKSRTPFSIQKTYRPRRR